MLVKILHLLSLCKSFKVQIEGLQRSSAVFYLLRKGRHIHGFDLPEGGETLQSFPGLLLNGDHERVLHVAVLGQLLR